MIPNKFGCVYINDLASVIPGTNVHMFADDTIKVKRRVRIIERKKSKAGIGRKKH